MKKTQAIELFNTIKKTLVSFVSIAFFVLLASAIYLGITWASTAFDLTTDKTISDWKMHDIEVSFPYGFTKEEIQKINNLDYVNSAEGTFSCEATFSLNGHNYQAKISMIGDSMDIIGKLEGNLPNKKDEIIVNKEFANKNNIKIGDKLVFIHDEKDDTYDLYNIINEDLDALQDKQTSKDGMKYLTTDTFTVTGIGVCSTGISTMKETYGVSQTTSIPNDCFMYALEDSFDFKAFAGYPTLIVQGEGLDEFGTTTDEYKEAFDTFKGQLEADLKPYIDQRNNKVSSAVKGLKQQINDKIADGEKQIADAESEINDGLKKIADAEKKIADGKKELVDAKKELEDGQKKIDDGYKELEDGQNTLNSEKAKKANVENAFKVLKALSNPFNVIYDSNMGALLSSYSSVLDEIKQFVNLSYSIDVTVESSRQSYNTAITNIDTILSPKTHEEFVGELIEFANTSASVPDENTKNAILMLASATNDFFNGASDLIELSSNETKLFNLLHSQGTSTLYNDQIITSVNNSLSPLSLDITDYFNEYYTKSSPSVARFTTLTNITPNSVYIYPTATNTLDSFGSIWATFNEKQNEINQGRNQLADARQEIEDGWVEYYDGFNEIAVNEKKIADAKRDLADAQADIEDGKQKIKDNKDKINDFDSQTEDLKAYDITLLGREFNAGIASAGVPADIMGKIKFTLALLFVIVGMLVTYSALSRSVYDQTILIGTKKALGLSRKDINGFFMFYAGIATTIGSLIGTLLARFVFEPLILIIISNTYELTQTVYYFSLLDSVLFYIFELSASLIITYIASNSILKKKAVKLLAGKEEIVGKERFFENTKLWQSLPLITKTIINNCLNDPRRVFATLVGITGCCSIMVCAICIFTSAETSIKYQFDNLTKFDSIVYYDNDIENAQRNVKNVLDNENLKSVDTMYSTYTLKNDDGTYLNASVFVYDKPEFLELFVLESNKQVFNTEGLCISKAYSTFRNKQIGDTISFIDNKGNEHSLPICGVFDNYLIKAEIVLDSNTYEKEFNEDLKNTAFIVQSGDQGMNAVYNKLKDVEGFVSIVDFKKESLESYSTLQNPIYGLIAAFFFLAIVLAFLVLLNLLVMFVDEKKRELIILMINGFSKKYARKYIYSDTIILTILGIICGICLGAFIGLATVKTFDSDLITLVREINIPSYLICGVLTGVLSAISCLMALSKINQFKLTDINKT